MPLARSNFSNRKCHFHQVLNDALDRGLIKPFDRPPAKRGEKKKVERAGKKELVDAISIAELAMVIEHARSNNPR